MTLNELTTPTWWLTAVAGAVVLKVLSDYTKVGIEKVISKGLSAWSSRSKTARDRFDTTVNALRSSGELREDYFQREIRVRSLATQALILSVLCAIFFVVIYLFYIAPHLDEWNKMPFNKLSWLLHDSDKLTTLGLLIVYAVVTVISVSTAIGGVLKGEYMGRALHMANKSLLKRNSESEQTEEQTEN